MHRCSTDIKNSSLKTNNYRESRHGLRTVRKYAHKEFFPKLGLTTETANMTKARSKSPADIKQGQSLANDKKNKAGKIIKGMNTTKEIRMRTGSKFTALISFILILLSITKANANLINNGDFETGDLTGWTVFTTPNGTNGFWMPKVVDFDTCADEEYSSSAKFKVGKIWCWGSGGGGIYQFVNIPAGQYELSVCTAVLDEKGCCGDMDGGLFELIFDDEIVDSYYYGFVAKGITYRHELSADLSLDISGDHEIKIRITRNNRSLCGSPYQYIDCVNMITPEPATIILLGLGGYVAIRRKEQKLTLNR